MKRLFNEIKYRNINFLYKLNFMEIIKCFKDFKDNSLKIFY